MRFTLSIECDNAAFEDDASIEVSRILSDTARTLVHEGMAYGPGTHNCTLRDVNGNTVGRYRFEETQ